MEVAELQSSLCSVWAACSEAGRARVRWPALTGVESPVSPEVGGRMEVRPGLGLTPQSVTAWS